MFGRKKTIVVKEYKGEKSYKRDVSKMARKGYVVQTAVAQQDGRSKKSWVGLGLFNFLRKQKVKYMVTYKLETA
jgi:hypothetical protein